MKKIFYFPAGFVALVFLAVVVLWQIYKKDIQHQINKSIHEYVDADVYYNSESLSLSFFRHFPHPTLSLSTFGIVGRNTFKGDTLVSVDKFSITVDIFSLFREQKRLKGVDLQRPRMFIRILEDGSANYDIVKSTEKETEQKVQEQESGFSLGIDSWSIKNGLIEYDDRQLSFYAFLNGFDHHGKGDFTLDVFDMFTSSLIKKAVVRYEDITYLNGQQVSADVAMNMNLKDFVFTFKDNKLNINDLGVSMQGFIAMPADDINLDISFATEGANIKSLYSLIPAVYTSEYEGIETSGTLDLYGKVAGTYSETQMPGFDVTLKAQNGMIKYPELKMPVKGIDLDMQVKNEDGITEHTVIDIRTLKMTVGEDPVEARLLIKNLKDYDMLADVKARINLKNLTAVFPLEDMELGGLFNINLHAKGILDTVKNIFPIVDATMELRDGLFKNSMLPQPIEGLEMNARITCPTGNMKDLVVRLDPLRMRMGSDHFLAWGTLANPLNYQWDISAKGRLDLQAISEMIPMDGVHYEGMLTADIKTKGKYSDLQAGRYDKVPTSGRVSIENLQYRDADLPIPIEVSSAVGIFTPGSIRVDHLKGRAGKSDFSLSGSVSRYMNYLFGENEVLKGSMNLNAGVIDVDEWMETTGENVEEIAEDSLQTEMPEIPKDIDFEFKSNIGKIRYDNLVLENVRGLFIAREGMLIMKGLSFETLGGQVVMDGLYDMRNPEMPLFSYMLNMKEISLPGAYASFNPVKTFAPMAKAMDGSFFTDFKISGKMKRDMTPVYESIDGSGSIEIKNALVKNSRFIESLNGLTGMHISTKELHLNDIKILASMQNGRAYVRPFNIRAGGHDIRVSGSIGADGSLDYTLDTEIEAGEKGQQINALLASLSGKQADSTETKIKLKIKIGGTYDQPKLSLAGIASADGRSELKTKVKNEVADQAETVKEETKSQLIEGIGHVLEGDTAALERQADSLKNILNSDKLEDIGKQGEDIMNSLQNLFKKKKKDDHQ